jgi:hypothetical protein
MSIAPAGDYGNDASDPDLRALLDRPFHAVEFEDGERQGDLRSGHQRSLFLVAAFFGFAKRELNAILGDRRNSSAANLGTTLNSGCDVELLANFGAKDASKMRGMVAHQGGSVSDHFVSDPAAASHEAVLSKSGFRNEVRGQRLDCKGEIPGVTDAFCAMVLTSAI